MSHLKTFGNQIIFDLILVNAKLDG